MQPTRRRVGALTTVTRPRPRPRPPATRQGVPRDAQVAAIKRAYREMAKMWHPDTFSTEVRGLARPGRGARAGTGPANTEQHSPSPSSHAPIPAPAAGGEEHRGAQVHGDRGGVRGECCSAVGWAAAGAHGGGRWWGLGWAGAGTPVGHAARRNDRPPAHDPRAALTAGSPLPPPPVDPVGPREARSVRPRGGHVGRAAPGAAAGAPGGLP